MEKNSDGTPSKESKNTSNRLGSVLGIPAYIAYRWMMPGFIAASFIAVFFAFNPDITFTWLLKDISTVVLLLGGVLGYGFIVSLIAYPHMLVLRERQKYNYYILHGNDVNDSDKLSTPCSVFLTIIPIMPILCYKCFLKNHIININRKLHKIYSKQNRGNVSQDFHLAYGSMNIGYSLLIVTIIINVYVKCWNYSWLFIISGSIYLLSTFYAWKMLGYAYDKLFWHIDKSAIENDNYNVRLDDNYNVRLDDNNISVKIKNRNRNVNIYIDR